MSRVRWQKVYHFGDFHGEEETLLKYFDAHLYIANWGTVRLGLALPATSLPWQAIQPYLRGGEDFEVGWTLQNAGDRRILWWERREDDGWGSTDGEGVLERLLGLREEILRGDYRALFLGWLGDLELEAWTDRESSAVGMPPIPGGLDRLSPALTALIEQFPVDPDALAVAASLAQASTPERIPIATVVERLSVSEMRALLGRVAEGEGSKVMAELNRSANPAPAAASGSTLSCPDFAARVIVVREPRLQAEARAKAAKREREAEAKRQRLTSVMNQADALWAGLEPGQDPQVAADVSPLSLAQQRF